MRIVISLLLLALAYGLLRLGIEPVPTWFYVFAWYPTLVLLDSLAARLGGGLPLTSRPRAVVSLWLWSPVIWLVFEATNFRLDNWYYVNLPRSVPERWSGILLSFATVVPAIVLAAQALEAAGVGRGWRRHPLSIGTPDLRWWWVAGGAGTAAVLVWPDLLYPLIWGTPLLLVEPIVYRRRSELSLLADVERGDWGRIARLMLGGLGIGLLWELYNYGARGKWIYTVPLLERLKWFEMPPLGFVGFPFFALEAWAMYSALVALGVAAPITGKPGRGQAIAGELGSQGAPAVVRTRPRSMVLAVLIAAGFSVATLTGMERWTISSTVPDPAAVPAAELAAFRGIGAEHARSLDAVGVTGVCDLAVSDPHRLWQRVHGIGPRRKRPTPAEVRVWIRAAREQCET